jgi:adenine-specific DNA-methyltransferase
MSSGCHKIPQLGRKADDAVNPDLLWLALAVANSSFIKAFYDHRFNNKLYAGRRRFITQYVELFPLPDPSLKASQEIVELAKQIFDLIPDKSCDQLIDALDIAVWTVFGLDREEVPG